MMATSKKYYRERICSGCSKVDTIRADSKADKCRSCAKKGEDNPLYKTTSAAKRLTVAEYKKFHARVYRTRGKATKCFYGCIASKYHWANMSGKYDDVMDYIHTVMPNMSQRDRFRRVR